MTDWKNIQVRPGIHKRLKAYCKKSGDKMGIIAERALIAYLKAQKGTK
jgi:hypothetical protein